MGLPPLDAGGFQLTTAWSLLVAAVTFKGAPGTVEGITASDGEDGEPVPAALVAVTVKEYEVPLVSPVTVAVVSAVTTMWSPGEETTE